MSGRHPWPNGYISGWCSSQLVADHARCRLEHTTDRDAPGCHCAPCALPVTLIAAPEPAADDPVEAFLSDTTMSAAVAPPAEQSGATAATKIMPELDELREAGPDPATLSRLEAVLELHAPLRPIRPGGTGTANCAHCGRHHPCPTRRIALGEVA